MCVIKDGVGDNREEGSVFLCLGAGGQVNGDISAVCVFVCVCVCECVCVCVCYTLAEEDISSLQTEVGSTFIRAVVWSHRPEAFEQKLGRRKV